jgi:hypothetical protein
VPTRPRMKLSPAAATGRPRVDKWPRIAQADDLLDGHAHIKGTKVPVYRMLRQLSSHPLPLPYTMLGSGVREADVVAALAYGADILQQLPRLIAELKKLHAPRPQAASTAPHCASCRCAPAKESGT